MSQSIQEANRVFEEWLAGYAPKDLVNNDSNQILIADYLRLHFAKVVSITNLNAAVANIPNLEYAPKKSLEQLSAEFRAKELKRRLEEEAANKIDVAGRISKSVEDKKAKDEHEKQQDVARNAIDAAIEGYQCYRGPNRIDWALTEQRKSKLRGIVAANKNADQIKVLALIRRTILEFPDPNERSR